MWGLELAGDGAGLEIKLGTSGKALSAEPRSLEAQGSYGQALSKGRPGQLPLVGSHLGQCRGGERGLSCLQGVEGPSGYRRHGFTGVGELRTSQDPQSSPLALGEARPCLQQAEPGAGGVPPCFLSSPLVGASEDSGIWHPCSPGSLGRAHAC